MDRRIALVTGANRGMGFETCRQLAKLGHRVIVTSRTLDRAKEAAARLSAERLDVVPLEMNVAEQESVLRAHRHVAAHIGSVDILVNNAAVLEAEHESLLDIELQTFRSTFHANVFGAVEVCRMFVPAMVKRRFGRVVNVSSGAGQLSSMSTYAPAYSMSKAALNALTRILAATVSGGGVLVNCVDPGWVRTDMGGPGAPRSVAQGVDTIVWLATLPASGPTGGFFRDRKPIAW
jgi:NAD(P)-dependent dehydrogenase (short-subunit alcohol dehydrogenase family)